MNPRTRSTLVGLIALTTLTVLSTVAASEPVSDAEGLVARLQSRDVAFEGDASVGGELAAMVLKVDPWDDPALEPGGRFRVHGERLHLEVDRLQYDYSLVATTTRAYPSSSSHDYDGVRIDSADPRGAYELAIAPVDSKDPPQVEARWGSSRWTPSALEVVSVENRINASDPDRFTAATSDSLDASSPSGLKSLRVTGDFRVSLWNWNFTVTGSHRAPDAFFTGERWQQVTPPVGPTNGIRSNVTRQQAYLEVTGGVLEFVALPSQVDLVLLRSIAVEGDGRWTLRQAEGAVSDGQVLRPAAAREARLEGRMEAASRVASDKSVSTSFIGAAAHVAMDGDSLPWAAGLHARSAPPSRWLPWALGAMALVALPGVAWGGRSVAQRRDRSRMESLELMRTVGADDAVARDAERLLDSRSFGADAAVLKAEALVRAGRTEEARSFVRGLGPWQGPAAAMLDYLRGYVAAHAGDHAAAAAHLADALRAAPEFRGEIMVEPAFEPLRRRGPLARLLAASVPHGRGSVGYA